MSEKERLQAVATIAFGLGAVSMGFTIYAALRIAEALS